MAERQADDTGDVLLWTAPTGKRVIMSFAHGKYSAELQEETVRAFVRDALPGLKAHCRDLGSDIVFYVNPDKGLGLGI